ncbi:hypothetical protein GCM10009430_31980 [Aquimarina litoralis]|uniref:Lipoprotein n=1 Tax=Aquimarina litoralis TaxID=584605 RepID=A0ABP3U957_9FLAO
MKKFSLIILGVLISISCETDNLEDYENVVLIEENIDEAKGAVISSQFNNKTLKSPSGRVFYAGIGYSPSRDKVYNKIAFKTKDLVNRVSNEGHQGTTAEISVIKTYKELKTFVKSYKLEFGEGVEFFSENGESRNLDRLSQDLTIRENAMTVIAKIRITDTRRYDALVNPDFTPQALEMVQKGKIREFFREYGSMYIDKQRLGGDVFYYFTFRNSNFRSDRVTPMETEIANLFSNLVYDASGNVTFTDEKVIRDNLIKRGFITNIKGFRPKQVKNVQDFRREQIRVKRYLNGRPSAAATVDLKLRSYASILANVPNGNELLPLFNRELKCKNDLDRWERFEQEIKFIRLNTSNSTLRSQATQALNEIRTNINRSTNCNNSVTPSETRYQSIKIAYSDEII